MFGWERNDAAAADAAHGAAVAAASYASSYELAATCVEEEEHDVRPGVDLLEEQRDASGVESCVVEERGHGAASGS